VPSERETQGSRRTNLRPPDGAGHQTSADSADIVYTETAHCYIAPPLVIEFHISGRLRSCLKTGPAGAYKLCHYVVKKTRNKIATLAMITQRRQTYASHEDFDSFTVFMSISMQKIL